MSEHTQIKPKFSLLTLLKKNALTLTGAFTGAVAGYLYWHFVGCSSGTCAITSRPLNSTLYGMVMGALLFSSFQKDKRK